MEINLWNHNYKIIMDSGEEYVIWVKREEAN